jgi:hypothetical protein
MIVDWFDGIAKVIVSIGSLGGLVTAAGAWHAAIKSRKAAEATAALTNAQNLVLQEQTGTLARVEAAGDGQLDAISSVAKKLGVQKDALAVEVERRQANPDEPTHAGEPTDEHRVGIVDGRAKTFLPRPRP